MSDPFQTNNNAQLMREASVGLVVIVVLLILFAYLAFKKINGAGADLLERTEHQPIATHVWPNSDPPKQNSVDNPAVFKPREIASFDNDTLELLERRLARIEGGLNHTGRSNFSPATTKPAVITPTVGPSRLASTPLASTPTPKPAADSANSFALQSLAQVKTYTASLSDSNHFAPPQTNSTTGSTSKIATSKTLNANNAWNNGFESSPPVQPSAPQSKPITVNDLRSPFEPAPDSKVPPTGFKNTPIKSTAPEKLANAPVSRNLKSDLNPVPSDNQFSPSVSPSNFPPERTASLDNQYGQPDTSSGAFQPSQAKLVVSKNDFETMPPKQTDEPEPEMILLGTVPQTISPSGRLNPFRSTPPAQQSSMQVQVSAEDTFSDAVGPRGAHPELKPTSGQSSFGQSSTLATTEKPLVQKRQPQSTSNPFAPATAADASTSNPVSPIAQSPITQSPKPPTVARNQLREFSPLQTGLVTQPSSVQRPVAKLPARPGRHTAAAGDSFWSIAEQAYEDGRLFRALYEYNRPKIGPNTELSPGTVVMLPAESELRTRWPEFCPRIPTETINEKQNAKLATRFHVTRQNETLFEIARDRLDQASRYVDILKMNETRLPAGLNSSTPLQPGIKLTLPLQ